MSWDILPKSNLQYFLQKLKDKLDKKADNSDVTEIDTTNNTPFLYRKTPYEADGVFLDELVGADVVVNQLQVAPTATTSFYANNVTNFTFSDGVATFTASVKNGNINLYPTKISIIEGHTYLVSVKLKTSSTLVKAVFYYSNASAKTLNTFSEASFIVSASSSTSAFIEIQDRRESGWDAIQVKEFMVIDLTQMFGTTIADTAYTKETEQSGSGIQWLRDNGFDFSKYIAYNLGAIESVNPSGKKVVGFNQWDEEWEVGAFNSNTGEKIAYANCIRSKNYISVLPSHEYYCNSVGKQMVLYSYDKDKNYLGATYKNNNTAMLSSNTHYVMFEMADAYGTTYNHDICINISKPTGAPKNGDYVPYEEKTYPISQSPLHGLFKLDNDKIVADGDIRKSNGETTRKYNKVTFNGNQDYSKVGAVSQNDWSDTYRTTNAYGIRVFSIENCNCKPSKYVLNDFGEAFNNRISGLQTEGVGSNSGNVSTLFVAILASRLQTVSVSGFKTWLESNPITISYEVSYSVTEQLTPFTNPQICYKDGTEEFIDNRTVPVPVGHNSTYANLPSIMDGDYLNYMAKNFASEEYVDTGLGTKVDKVSGKDLSTNDYTNEEKALVETIPDKADSSEVTGTKTATGNPITLTDGSETYAQGLSVDLEPVQDLHGYDYPWVGGAGKNKFPLSVESVKDYNSDKQWSGNSFTVSNVTLTLLTDNDGNCIGIDFDGTASSFVRFVINAIPADFPDGNYLVNGVNGGSVSTYIGRFIWKENRDTSVYNGEDTEVTISSTDSHSGNFGQFRFEIQSGVTLDHVKIYPQIRLSTETDPTFAPYSNICPISGYTECEVKSVGKNLLDPSKYSNNSDYCVFGGNVNDLATNGNVILDAGTYTFSVSDIMILMTARVKSGDNATTEIVREANVSKITFTLQERNEVRLTIQKSNFVFNNYTYQVERGNQATTYEPYQSRTASVTFGQTVYGGTVDFLTGELTVDMGYDDLGALTWTKDANRDGRFYTNSLTDVKTEGDGVCEGLRHYNTGVNANEDNIISFVRSYGNNYIFAICKTYSDATSFTNAMTGIKLAYELAEPFTIQLTPQELKLLQDTNNLTTNGTTITLDYIPNNSIGDAVRASEEYTDRALKNKADKDMPYLQYLNNNVVTNINKYQIINKFDSEGDFPEATALPISNTTDMNKHRFLFVELFYDIDLQLYHTMQLLASVMIDANSLSEFEYIFVKDSIREVGIYIHNGNLNVYFDDKGEIYEKNAVTDYYLTVRLVD